MSLKMALPKAMANDTIASRAKMLSRQICCAGRANRRILWI